jgi:hypothetical protein
VCGRGAIKEPGPSGRPLGESYGLRRETGATRVYLRPVGTGLSGGISDCGWTNSVVPAHLLRPVVLTILDNRFYDYLQAKRAVPEGG